jgi:hypothetical protein
MINLPVDNYPCSDADVIVPDEEYGVLNVTTSWTDGQVPTWTMDIADEAGNPVLSGINVVPGADNVIKGNASVLGDFRMIVEMQPDLNPGALEIMGRELFPSLLVSGDENPVGHGDPLMENIVPLDPVWGGSMRRRAKLNGESALYGSDSSVAIEGI